MTVVMEPRCSADDVAPRRGLPNVDTSISPSEILFGCGIRISTALNYPLGLLLGLSVMMQTARGVVLERSRESNGCWVSRKMRKLVLAPLLACWYASEPDYLHL